jgi:aerobic carbon-monoxide dehydrogenase small subunit
MTDATETEMTVQLTVTVNGRMVQEEVRPNLVLADLLAGLGLRSVRVSCDQNVCGACTVLMDGEPTASCSTFAFQAHGRTVETLEGLANEGELHPIQKAFVENYAFQCGFCTPGMVMTCKALLDREPHPGEDRIRSWMAGNICRCTGYGAIVAAIRSAGEPTS